MDQASPLQALREASLLALQAQDALLAAWRRTPLDALLQAAGPDDVRLFRELVVRRIYPLNAFEALVRINPTAVVEVLLSRYVGSGVDPDRKFGGYSFELSGMLGDLAEVCGESALGDLVAHPRFNPRLFADRRFVESLADALSVEPDRIGPWLAARCGTSAAPDVQDGGPRR